MRRVAKLPIVCVLVGLVVLVGSGVAGARGTRTLVCGSSDHHLVVARNVQAEVYRVHKDESEVYEYWGCVVGSKRSFKLGRELVSGSPYGSLSVAHVTLAGTTAAYESELSSGTGDFEKSKWYIVVVSLRTGRVFHRVPTGVTYPPNPNFVGDGPVTVIVVKNDGTVAWILDTVQSQNRYQIHALDPTGERVLAVGSNIVPNSLALAGSMLYWTQGGKPMSATLN